MHMQVRKVIGKRGVLPDCPHRNTTEKNSKYLVPHKTPILGNFNFFPTINFIQISIELGMEDLRAG